MLKIIAQISTNVYINKIDKCTFTVIVIFGVSIIYYYIIRAILPISWPSCIPNQYQITVDCGEQNKYQDLRIISSTNPPNI